MAFFIVIGGSWLVIALMLLWSLRRSEDPMTGQWRAQPSTFFGGPPSEPAASPVSPAAVGGPVPVAPRPAPTGV